MLHYSESKDTFLGQTDTQAVAIPHHFSYKFRHSFRLHCSSLHIFLFCIIFVSHIFSVHLLAGQQAWLLLVLSQREQSLVLSRPQLGASTAGPVWRRAAYKLYPPGEHSLSTMPFFTECLHRRHTNPPWEWARGSREHTLKAHTQAEGTSVGAHVHRHKRISTIPHVSISLFH